MKYAPLKVYIARNGGIRLHAHGRLTEWLIDTAVEEWPQDCPPSKIKEVLTARLNIKVREKYSGFIAALIISVIVQAVARLIVEWWFDRESNRTLMSGWSNVRGNPR